MRLTLPTLLTSAVLLAGGTVAAWYVHHLQEDVTEMLASNVTSVRAAEEFEIGMREVETELTRYLLSGERQHLERVLRLRQTTDHWLAEADRFASTPLEQELMDQVNAGYAGFFDQFTRSYDAKLDSTTSRQQLALVEQRLANEILRPAHEYLNYNQEMVEDTMKRTQATGKWIVLGLLALGICGGLVGLLLGLSLAQRIRRSIVQLRVPIVDVAGKLNPVVAPLTVSADWSFAELEAALHKLADEVHSVVAKLQQSQREVLRADQLAAVGQLAAGLAHEMRNPLTSMKILVQSATEQGEDASLGGRDLTILEEEITRLEHLVRTFLDFARPPRLQMQPIALGVVVEQVLKLVSVRAEQQGVRLQTELPDQPVILDADPGQVRQVLVNLLLNALDAVPSGGRIRIRVALDREASADANVEPREWVTLQVADSGLGLPADLGERIFEPFVSTKETGIGLGLSICKRIIETHQGEITAGNGPEGGAVFTVQLPRRTSTAPRHAISNARRSRREPTRTEDHHAHAAHR
jgi:signal transduction histidine kinase